MRKLIILICLLWTFPVYAQQAVKTVSGSTTAATQATGTNLHTVVDSGSITANAGTNLNTSLLELDATGAALNLAQGSTTSGQTGPLVQTATTTAAPTYTTAKTNPLSTTTGGGLRVDVTTLGGASFTGNTGTATNGTIRVVLATDQPQLTNKLLVTPDSVALPANQSTNISQVNAHTLIEAGVNGSQAVGGCVATNTATPCNPMNLGAQAVSSENSAATTAREVQLVADLVGKLIVLPYANPENFVNGTTAAITDTTSTSTIASAGGSLRNYITSACITNSHATVGTFVKLLEGSNIIWEVYAAPAGGGACQTFAVPLRGAAATAINCQPVTTGANVICTAAGYKGI